MKVTEDTVELREGIKNAVKRYILEEKKKGIHLSMLYMPLKSYFYLKYPEIPLTDNEVYYFVIGRGYHAILDAIVKHYESANFRFVGSELEFDHKGLFYYTPDLIFKFGSHYMPVEVKTTRLQDISKDNIPESYLFQLKGYTALLNVHIRDPIAFGYLYIISVVKNESHLFKIEMSHSEMENTILDLEARAKDLITAVRTSNPDLLLRYGKIPEWASREMRISYKQYGIDKYISK